VIKYHCSHTISYLLQKIQQVSGFVFLLILFNGDHQAIDISEFEGIENRINFVKIDEEGSLTAVKGLQLQRDEMLHVSTWLFIDKFKQGVNPFDNLLHLELEYLFALPGLA
jgi:hypothetical protein